MKLCASSAAMAARSRASASSAMAAALAALAAALAALAAALAALAAALDEAMLAGGTKRELHEAGVARRAETAAEWTQMCAMCISDHASDIAQKRM